MSFSGKKSTHYKILSVSRNASQDVIKAAYRVLAQKYHPDKNASSGVDTTHMMETINTAYEILSDPIRREKYDADLARQEQEARSKSQSWQQQYKDGWPAQEAEEERPPEASQLAARSAHWIKTLSSIFGFIVKWITIGGLIAGLIYAVAHFGVIQATGIKIFHQMQQEGSFKKLLYIVGAIVLAWFFSENELLPWYRGRYSFFLRIASFLVCLYMLYACFTASSLGAPDP